MAEMPFSSPMKAREGGRLGNGDLYFYFDGKPLPARQGDTAASALLAAGEHILGRSFKYHRPRGILTAGPDEPNVLLGVGPRGQHVPNMPATCIPITRGLQLHSQNCWPSPKFDLLSTLGILGAALSAGFYYKTFKWPNWTFFEHTIRRMAGLGYAPRTPTVTGKIRYLHADVAVIGGGPAGLCAALAAQRAGASVLIIERDTQFGGELEIEDATFEGQPAMRWVADSLAAFREAGGASLDCCTVVSAGGKELIALHRPSAATDRVDTLKLKAGRIIAAMGATERPIAFANNDLPGVMLLSAAMRFLRGYGVTPGKRVVVFGNNDRVYSGAALLARAGVTVVAVVDTRSASETERSELVGDLAPVVQEAAIVKAYGRRRVRGVLVRSAASEVPDLRLRCDAVLVSGGWTPCSLQALGSDNKANGHDADKRPGDSVSDEPQPITCVGAMTGSLALSTIVGDACRAGIAAGTSSSSDIRTSEFLPEVSGPEDPRVRPYWRAPASVEDERKQFIDLQNDVTVADLRQATAEGMIDIEHVKRYTTLGIGTDQGHYSGLMGAAILAEFRGGETDASRVSRARPPFQPVPLGALLNHRSADHLRPLRTTPLNEQHLTAGAIMEDAGAWSRPRYYRPNGVDLQTAAGIEALRVRQCGGILDASTLGKIDVRGSAAARFLDRIYLNSASRLAVGRGKYMAMCREDGMLLDDGILLRHSDNHFTATVSSGHALHVLSHMELYRDLEFSAASVQITDVTEAWAVIVAAGPASREALKQVLSCEFIGELPHMAFRETLLDGLRLRVLRASFSGELGYELHGHPKLMAELWSALVAAGLPPYGTEALDILRVEKGYLVDAEINGQTTPADLGLERIISNSVLSIGADLLDRPGLTHANRPRLVGLQALDKTTPFEAGAQLTRGHDDRSSLGHVSSAVFSPVLRRWVGLGLCARRVVEGDTIWSRDDLRGRTTLLKVTSPVHIDPTGSRMKS